MRIKFIFLLLALAAGWVGLRGSNTVYADNNFVPTIESVVISTSPNGTEDSFVDGNIYLIAGSTKTIFINGLVQDLDGRDTITNVLVAFRRSDLSQECTTDLTNCYPVPVCSLSNNEDVNQKIYSCQVDLMFSADSTDAGGRYPAQNWSVYIEVSDGTNEATSSTLTKEVSSLLSLSIPSSLNFGPRSLGDITTSETNIALAIAQSGNTPADVEVSMATHLACQVGSIARENIKWSLTDVGFASETATVLTTTPVDTNLFIGYGTNGLPGPTKDLYWNISIPLGVGGDCFGNTEISTIAH